MNVSPLDHRQQRFRKAFRGFDPVEVASFLAAADDYEQALRDDKILFHRPRHAEPLDSAELHPSRKAVG